MPGEKDPIGVKNKYIHMVQAHSSVQLSMGAATIEGMLNVDTVFDLRLLSDANGKPRQPPKTPVKENFSMMMVNDGLKVHKVWICLSTGTNGMTTGYFSSVVPAIRDHLAAFIMCLAAQVYWWLGRRGCLMEDINHLIRHCFTLSQQQWVTKSKFMKDLGHAVIDQTDADDIINAAATQGIYDLTLGLSDKEKRAMVAGKAHDASTITFGKAKEGSMGAYDFSSVQLVTSTHSVLGGRRLPKPTLRLRASPSPCSASIDTGTSKVTEDNDTANSKKESSSDSEEDGSQPGKKTVAIEGMGILIRQDDEHKATKTGKEKDEVMECTGSKDSEAEDKEEEFQDDE